MRSAFGGGACVFFLSVGELKGDNSADLGPFLEFVLFLPFLEDVGCTIASSGDAPRERARACSHPQQTYRFDTNMCKRPLIYNECCKSLQ